MGYPCACCGFKTLEKPGHDTWGICHVCFWEDDPVQNETPDYQGGANKESLREAQANFKKLGAASGRVLNLVRVPTPDEARDPGWAFLE